jgi:hypothetical protein
LPFLSFLGRSFSLPDLSLPDLPVAVSLGEASATVCDLPRVSEVELDGSTLLGSDPRRGFPAVPTEELRVDFLPDDESSSALDERFLRGVPVDSSPDASALGVLFFAGFVVLLSEGFSPSFGVDTAPSPSAERGVTGFNLTCCN